MLREASETLDDASNHRQAREYSTFTNVFWFVQLSQALTPCGFGDDQVAARGSYSTATESETKANDEVVTMHQYTSTNASNKIHSLIEIRTYGPSQDFAVGCTMDLFESNSTSKACKVDLADITVYWSRHRASPTRPPEEQVRFKFGWKQDNSSEKEHEWDVFDDVSLRPTFRLWLSMDNTKSPFVLVACVKAEST
jgi:hypothetical protein